MSARRAPRRAMNTTLTKGRKSTQRERLSEAMIAVANRDGYARANVSAIIAEAGVSRPTFYDYFSDRQDCLLAVLAEVNARMLETVTAAIEAEAPGRALAGAVRGLTAFASSEPAMARFLTNEPTACGGPALDVRDEGIAAIDRLVEARCRAASPGAPTPDVCARVLIGALYRVLASRLRRGEGGLAAILEDLLDLLTRYEVPVGEHRWRTLRPVSPLPTLPREIASTPLRAPEPLRPGRPRLSSEEVAQNHRRRILYAVATLAESKGYHATTIAEIAARAGLDGHTFYALFKNKQDAFMAVHEIGFQEVMSVTADAFFKGSTWPERSWEAGRALVKLLQTNPLIAHVGFIEADAVGPRVVQRIEDGHAAFAIFLQEGYQYAPQQRPPARVALEVIITAVFESIYERSRRPGKPQLAGLLPHLTFVALAPFLGAAEANRFLERQLAKDRRKKRPRARAQSAA